MRDWPSLMTTRLSVLMTLVNGSKACPNMQTLFSNRGNPSFFFTNFIEICCWNWAKEFSYFIVQY
jgi:hypothetical protein